MGARRTQSVNFLVGGGVDVDVVASHVVRCVLQLASCGLGAWGGCGRGVHVDEISVLKGTIRVENRIHKRSVLTIN